MVDTSNTPRREKPSPAEQRMLREVHSAAIPPAEPYIDTAVRALRAEQEAGRLVASGALDPDTIVAGEGPLTGEASISARSELDQTEVHKERLAAAQRGMVNIVAALDGDLTPGRSDTEGSLAESRVALAEATKTVAAAETAAAAAITGLRGAAPVPATRATAPGTIRRWWWWRLVLPTALVAALELIATANAVYVFMRLDDALAALVVAATALVGLTLLPTLAGILAAEWREEPGRNGWRLASMATLLGMWVLTGVSLAGVRVLTTQELRAAEEASLNSLDEQASALGVETATAGSGAESFPAVELVFWIVVLLALGAFLFVKETFTHRREAAQRAELIARVNLWAAQDARTAWRGRVSAILNQVAIQKADLQTVDAIYVTEFEKIRHRAEYEKSRYRNELVLVAGDPEMTSAFEVRFGRETPPAPFEAPKLALPAWATADAVEADDADADDADADDDRGAA